MIKQPTMKNLNHPRRGGATLIEVLMAILIMSIGIVSVATLFPISVLRSLHATQLTHATILRFNAESWIDRNTALVFDPDNNANLVEHENTNYVVDPMGYFTVNPTFQSTFGNDGAAPDARVERYSYNFADADGASSQFTLHDNWTRIVSGFPSASTVTSVTFPAGTDFTGALVTSPNSRIILIDVDGRRSEVREIDTTNSGSGVVTWTGNVNFTIAQARIETKERMYSYLISVRNTGGVGVQMDVVVYFRRPYNSKDEEIFATTQIDADEVDVTWVAGNRPSLRKGGYLFDIDTGRWHRIQNITDGSLTATIKLEQPTNDIISEALFINGIVKVYPIGSRP